MSEWISVRERLPEPFTPVIVYRRGKSGGPMVEQGCYTVNGWWKVYSSRIKSVTHWMPLPSPPED